MKIKSLAILLILSLTPMLYAEESVILEPPPEIMDDPTLVMIIPAGEYTLTVPEPGILVFSPTVSR